MFFLLERLILHGSYVGMDRLEPSFRPPEEGFLPRTVRRLREILGEEDVD